MTDRIARVLPIAALCAVSALVLASCGGGGGGGKPAPTPPGEMRVMPVVDPDTLSEAVAIEAGEVVEGFIDSVDDIDFFRLPLTEPSRVTFWATGEADTVIALLNGGGHELSAAGGSFAPGSSSGMSLSAAAATGVTIAASDGRVSVTTGLDAVFVRVSGEQGGNTGRYNLHHEVAKNLAPRALGAIPGVTARAGGAPVTVDLSRYFVDPEGDTLTFGTEFPAGQVGPVSLGLTVSGSVLEIRSPANMRLGPVTVTVTASDPFNLVRAQLSVTVSPGETPEEETQPVSDLMNDCVATTGVTVDDGPGAYCGSGSGQSEYDIRLTNTCNERVQILNQWSRWVEGGPSPASIGWTSVEPGETERYGTLCLSSRPTFKFCVFSSGRRCYDNPVWRTY